MVRHVTPIGTEGIEPGALPVDPVNVLSDTWSELSWPGFVREGLLQVGVWRGEPGRLQISDQAYHEVSTIRSGAVAVVDPDGARAEFGPGDTLVIERGFTGVWETLEPTETVYVMVTPA